MAQLLLAVLLVLGAAAPAAAQQKKIVVTGLSPEVVGQLQASAPANVRIVGAGPGQLLKEAADADAVLGTASAEVIRAGRQIRWMQTFSAIVLTNAKIIQGPNIADHAMAMLLSLTRELHRIIPNRASEEWTRGRHRPIELKGKTAVFIGVGGIGMQIAQRARAFDMRVVGVDPKDIPYTPLLDRVIPPDRLDTVLPEADVVFVAAPHTPQSERMMGGRQFELLKKGAYFIAVSRGKLYDTGALVRALDEKRLAGAGLDVTDPEPLPKGHPLWRFENVIVTPHIAGQSDRVQERRIALLKENIRRFAAGEPLLNVVDKQKGY